MWRNMTDTDPSKKVSFSQLRFRFLICFPRFSIIRPGAQQSDILVYYYTRSVQKVTEYDGFQNMYKSQKIQMEAQFFSTFVLNPNNKGNPIPKRNDFLVILKAEEKLFIVCILLVSVKDI